MSPDESRNFEKIKTIHRYLLNTWQLSWSFIRILKFSRCFLFGRFEVKRLLQRDINIPQRTSQKLIRVLRFSDNF